MTWKRVNETGMDGRRHGGGGILNRECRNCTPPCQGGEKLHPKRLDYACSHSYCLCLGFEPLGAPVLTSALEGRVKSKRRFLDQGTVES